MKFELNQIIAMIENLLRTHPNRSDYDYLVELKADMEQRLQKLEKKCDFCSEPCPNPECFAKEEE